MNVWLPGYEHDPEGGAGLSVTAGNPKVVIHTTESPRGSYDAVRALWRGSANWGRGLPHFLADGARYVQLLPLNVGAYTLENAPGGADTNRSGPAIQVEICGRAAEGFNDLEYEALGKWLADLVKNGLDIDVSEHPEFFGSDAGFTLASYDARQRMGALEYMAFNGFCGHQHVPENAHWDPGKLDALRVERLARAHLGGTTPVPPKPSEEDDDDMLKAPRKSWVTASGAWFALTPNGRLGYIDGPSALAALQTPAEGQPAEILSPIKIADGVEKSLERFYGKAD